MKQVSQSSAAQAVGRMRALYVVLLVVIAIFGIRLFYVQVIHYSYYEAAALSDQLKEYQIPATRGLIEAQEGNSIVPIVLNQELYTLYVDPLIITNASHDSKVVTSVIGGDAGQYKSAMQTKGTQYLVIATKITAAQSKKILSYDLPGINTQGQDYRVYPQGSLASQLLGFVNNSGVGEYGIEQALNPQLTGTPGQLKAITAANGVPLPASNKNIETKPVNGANEVLTINMGMQAQMEQILQNEYKATKSQGLSAIIMDPYNGQVDAMANYPTYDPANYTSVTDASLFQNAAVDNAIEPGSSMKTLTTSAALDQGVIQPNTSFYDPAHWVVDGFNITDIEQDGGPRQQNIQSILSLSLNTGAVWMLMQMGGGSLDQKGIDAWYNYMHNRFRLGQPTGIEQGYEADGYIPAPDMTDPSIDLTYANSAFGQGVTLTAIQEISALSSVLNGGTYYQPTLIAKTIEPDGTVLDNKPKVLEKNVVSPKIGPELEPLMEGVVKQYLSEGFGFMSFPSDYLVGGKTGTAQIAQPGGGYSSTQYNGTYIGFVGGNKIQYMIVVFNIKPNVPGYAGSYGGQPVFADLAHMLINDSYVSPKS